MSRNSTVTAIPGVEFTTRFNRIESKLDAVSSLLVQVLSALNTVTIKELIMQADIQALTGAVQRNTDVENSAVRLLQALTAQIAAALASATTPEDIAQVQALVASLGASSDALAAAIVANTPAAPSAPVEPAPAADPIPVEPNPAS
jgi:hypothetical protein